MSETEKSIRNCGKCGLCLTACPVYKVLKEEQASPRARLQLIKAFEKGDLDASPLLKELISKCLMCGSCAAACPSGVNHYARFMDMRQQMARTVGDEPAVKSLIFLLSREYRLRMGAGMAKIGQKIAPRSLSEKYRLGNIPVDRFPRMNPRPLRRDLPERILPRGQRKGSVVYFTGCATNYLFDDTGRAAVQVLTHLGYEVVIPKKQTCCGIPLMFHGAVDQAAGNMAANINALKGAADHEDCKAVIVDCATCGAALKHEYPGLIQRLSDAKDPSLPPGITAESQAVIARKTCDLLSFVHRHIGDINFSPPGDTDRVVYHAPCHTRNAFAAVPAITDLIRGLPGTELIPLPDTEECCGGGGTFFYEYPDIARQMIGKKTASARNAQAAYWLTDCPVCRINLAGNLTPADKMQVIHPITLVSQRIAAP